MNNASVRLLVIVGVLTLALAALLRPATAKAEPTSTESTAAATRIALIRQIDHYRKHTWHWQRLMNQRTTPTFFAERKSSDNNYRRWIRDLWQRRARAAQRQAANPPHRAGWLCIHRYEQHPAQGWATHTGNGYYGGLQMDISFQRAYGPSCCGRKAPPTAGRLRADVGRRARLPQRPGLLPVAEHRA